MAVEVPRINGAAPEQDAKGQCQPFPFVETRGTAVERKSWREKRWREKRQPFPAVRREALGHSRRRCWSPGAVCRAIKPLGRLLLVCCRLREDKPQFLLPTNVSHAGIAGPAAAAAAVSPCDHPR